MRKLKVLLAFIYNSTMAATMEEIGISIIASVLRNSGYEVMVLAADENEVDYNQISSFKPDVVGFTVYQMSKDSVDRVSHKVCSLLPGVIIAMGGVYATYNSTKMLEENQQIDYVIRGEGEATFLELIEQLEKDEKDLRAIPGLTYRENDEIIHNEDRSLIKELDTLPFPARDILRQRGLKVALMSGSRGCGSNCSFCATQLFWKKWRGRSVKNIVDEIEYIVKEQGVNIFNFIDSSFEDPYSDLRRAKEIAEEIIKRDLSIFYFMDVRAEFNRKVTPEIMELLIKSGFIAVCIGIEAGNEADLKLYNKIATVEDNHKAIELFRKYDISIAGGFINFNPYSTIDRLRENLSFLEKYGYSYKFISKLAAFKGTAIHNRLNSDGLIIGEGEYDYKFCDERIEVFYNYLRNYQKELNTRYNQLFENINYYIDIYPHLLSLYKSTLRLKNHEAGLEILNKHKEACDAILLDFDKVFAEWIKRLIQIVESGWDYDQADCCTTEMQIADTFMTTEKNLRDLRDKLYINLARLGLWSILTTI